MVEIPIWLKCPYGTRKKIYSNQQQGIVALHKCTPYLTLNTVLDKTCFQALKRFTQSVLLMKRHISYDYWKFHIISNYSIDQGEHVEILLSIYLNMNKTKRSIKCFLLSLDCRVKTDIAGTGGGGGVKVQWIEVQTGYLQMY